MKSLISLHNQAFSKVANAEWIVPTLARLVFVAVLLMYYWNSATLKIDGSIFTPSAGAFGQIFPKAAEAAVYDVSQMNILQRLVIFLGTVAEFVLPLLLLVGLLTRLSALAMIGFVMVQTLVDVTGHGVKLGVLFDNTQTLIDERTLWVFLFAIIALKGAGPLSLDRLLRLS
ncbi:DoxX family membrane protein [Shimia thalassica]|uniref:DoxX family membrane protein n=1 Tax=Shimia thalassica TaxID=1715693 RepID=UPI0026E14CFB|nr:DoxX family membrane protein [Shimia thalassica]MDO6483435.1 DoxX family membrane protein [Shimia thalassica]MDO6521111.1 DoxX family membrane protein [Shimia thalassica]MDP2520740.1 DoxX family membrane protein [Shimia thalassica]MDP2581782.1 DoxX family membrane protein [Shimia thalassica]